MADIWDALVNPQTGATPAMIASLRNQQLLGQLGQIVGDPVTSQVGGGLVQSAQQNAAQLGKNELTQQERDTQQHYRDIQEKHYNDQLDQQAHALAETMRHNKADEENKAYELGKDDGTADDGGEPGGLNDFQEMVKSIKSYDKSPLNITTKNPRNLRIMAEVQRQAEAEGQPYDDTFYKAKQQTMNAFGGQGKQGQTVRSADVLTHHLGVLDQAIDSLNNTGPTPWNEMKNYVKKTFNLSTAPTDYAAVKNIVSDELVKFILGSGAGGVTDREGAQKMVDAELSSHSLKSVVQKYKELGMGQINGLKQEYEQNTRITNPADLRYFNRKLSPETRKAMKLMVPEDETARSPDNQPGTSQWKGWSSKIVG
jgi:hypothetical protein